MRLELPLPKERGFLLHRGTYDIATAEVRTLHRLTPQSLRLIHILTTHLHPLPKGRGFTFDLIKTVRVYLT